MLKYKILPIEMYNVKFQWIYVKPIIRSVLEPEIKTERIVNPTHFDIDKAKLYLFDYDEEIYPEMWWVHLFCLENNLCDVRDGGEVEVALCDTGTLEFLTDRFNGTFFNGYNFCSVFSAKNRHLEIYMNG